MSPHSRISATDLAAALGQHFPPTPQQAEVIESPLGPTLVVAGAGAGKTETMSARVVWLVANGLVEPDQVLGLTFTRKAAQQLNQRIRRRLQTLAQPELLRQLDPSGKLKKTLEAIAPSISTYDSFAGNIIREFGLLAPVEPDARLINTSEYIQLAQEVVADYHGDLPDQDSLARVVNKVITLDSELTQQVLSCAEVREESESFRRTIEEAPKAARQRDNLNQTMQKAYDAQQHRVMYLELVERLRAELHCRRLSTFGLQMATAADLAKRYPVVGTTLRRRYRVVMLDEYQDTSHAQRVLLSHLFGQGQDEDLSVTAVGDPMQAIYGWRGATAANLNQFITDFPHGDGSDAEKKQLTVSWRNPGKVLELANRISDDVFASSPEGRTVNRLESGSAEDGGLQFGFYRTFGEEREAVADFMEEKYRAAQRCDSSFSAAVLVRKNAHIAPIADALRQRGIPVEVVGLGGLLSIPEIEDLLGLANLLVNPGDSPSALRVLAGPMVGLGAADILALSRRAKNLSARAQGETDYLSEPVGDGDDSAIKRLRENIEHARPTDSMLAAGLGDVLADLGEKERYSEEGYRRLAKFSALLRHLRSRGLGRNITDIFADIIQLTGLRTELLSRENPRAEGATGTVHLQRFMDEVGNFSDIPGAHLGSFLNYCRLAKEYDRGLNPGEVISRSDRVQILTVHKAKGLEWHHVAVLHADSRNYGVNQVSTWVKAADKVPTIERPGEPLPKGTPVLGDTSGNRKEIEDAINAFTDEVKEAEQQENDRLFYVAVTRAEQSLSVSAAAWDEHARRAKPGTPHRFLEILQHHFPEAQKSWYQGGEQESEVETPPELVEEGIFPQLQVDDSHQRVWADIRAALEGNLPELGSQELHRQWEADAEALIEEYRQQQHPVVDVPLNIELTASDLVNMRRNSEWFARRLLRPVPFKPQSFAKRGTQFHQWIENFFGSTALIDETELPGADELIDGSTFPELRDAFIHSRWASLQPAYVEQAFDLYLGQHIIHGRMDAVFHNSDGSWTIVDWKTGHIPQGDEMKSASIQLAVYKLAWEEICQRRGEKNPDVSAIFHYVKPNRSIEPDRLYSRSDLERMLGD
ncbi:UvrD-helicase domain-containing protein [Corynebacterium sp. 3HC-13]|uniref:UvrD-helicase domain-containing protein n=1 Tax=Corynebacterium poyangense TaxID=2684405 RepID=UPI001CCE9853|nr:UvrD-helicase domain-containing protein [Corynebacterium poyangense]MBZ8176902.1 UvrD-helicase domain-containing protein [Corynebacterium poyangense]